MTHRPETTRIGLLCLTLAMGGMMSAAVSAGDTTLDNGIVLPEAWPPREPLRVGEPMPVPYLEHPPAVIPIDVGRQLFVDDFLIQSTTLTRTYHAAAWHPASPVLVPDRPWESPHQAMPFSDGAWYDPDTAQFVLWYQSGPQLTCRATSRDGIRWEKPPLDVEPGTNIVLRHAKRDSATVWVDRTDPDPARRYKALVFSKSPPRGLWLYASADGIHWGKPLVQSKNIGDRSTFFYNPFRQCWVFSLRIGMTPPGAPRARVYREHRDALAGLQWRESDGLLQQTDDLYPWVGADRFDPHHPDPRFAEIAPQLYNLDAVAYESLLVGLFSIWQGPENADCERLGVAKRNEVLLGFSRDGFHWHRPDRRPFLACSADSQAWNHANIQSAGGGCLVVGDQLFFYASGRRPIDDKGTTHDTTGLATLRRDGFASMDASESEGTLTTRPVRFRGKHLFVNAAVAGGALRVEVLDEQGNVLEPWTKANCRPIDADTTRGEVRWNGAANLAALVDKPVRFRFTLRNGSLYAFWVAPDASGASGGYVAAGGPGFTTPTDTVGQSLPPAPDRPAEPTNVRDPGSTRKTTEYWYDYEHIFQDILKDKDSVASAAPMPVKVNDLEFHKVYETPVGPKWSSWAQTYLTDQGAINVVFKVIEGGSAQVPADYRWQFIGPEALRESGITRTYRHMESTDNGQTWRDVAVYDASDFATPILLPALDLGKGTLLGVGGMCDGWDDARNSYTLIGTLMTALSHDNGKTWESRQTLNDPATKDRLIWCHPILSRDGVIVLPAYGTAATVGSLPNGHTEPVSYDAYLFLSHDRGKSWSKPLLLAKGAPSLSMEEPAVAELGNGDLLVMLRHTNPSKAGSNEVYVNCGQIIVRKINDQWVPGPLMRTHLGFRGMPALLRTRDGVLICAGSGNQYNFSVDDGKTWSATQVISDPACNRQNHYPVMLELAEGRIVSVYHLGSDLPYPPPEPEWIHSTSFTLSRP